MNAGTDPLVTRADIARRAGVHRPAVSNWQRRYSGFPRPVSEDSQETELFAEAEVQTWLDSRAIPSNARRPEESTGTTYGDRFRAGSAPVPLLSTVRTLVGEDQRFAGRLSVDQYDQYPLLLMALVHLREKHPGARGSRADLWRDVPTAVRKQLRGDGMHLLFDRLRPILDEVPPKMLADLGTALDAGSAPGGADAADAFDFLLARYGEVAHGKAKDLPTPPSAARTVAELVADGGRRTGDGTPAVPRLHDPYCRGGELLAAAVDAARAAGHEGFSTTPPDEWLVSGVGTDGLLLELARMSLDVRGAQGEWRLERELAAPGHLGTAERFGLVLTNPPFNARPRGDHEASAHWRYGPPPRHNANYDWLQYVVHTLSVGGRGCVVMPTNAASSANPGERRIRERMVEDGAVEGLVALPPQLFSTTAVAVTLWFLKHPTGDCRDIFFVDATRLGSMASRTQRVLSDADRDRLVRVYRAGADEAGFSRTVGIDEIRKNGYALSATAYLAADATTNPAGTGSTDRVRELAERLAALDAMGREADQHVANLLRGYGL
ncbi:type I restriction enzyme M protein [Streptomyces sp. LaPpAH-199]|uniref:N-6 DNA methylase n=1 Tax=Streptomyces TaxID=1883 RepID=UPI0008829A8A|nr:N-6 DNA methylase [Streptomyces sp. LaPpAH-199]MYW82709.1 N-6 DNA methylase [Streptomyces sp. SID8369]SDD93860.1 type I restriction enzyme M protein [Streptomyces sp. LaPpAH-199]